MSKIDYIATWMPVIGRALAFACLRDAQLGNKSTLEKARFLRSLGVSRRDAAEMLNTTRAALVELDRAGGRSKRGRAKYGRARAR